MDPSSPDFSANLRRFTGFAGLYDRHRPAPPAALAGLLVQIAHIARPEWVVDLGSGTGLSTRYWANHAEQVIGIEPTADMRQEAGAQTTARNVTYREGFSHQTGLPAACAQIVSCSQSLHWMEPAGTFREAARVLRPGGVFAACDYDWPPASGSWEADAAYEACMKRVKQLEKDSGSGEGLKRWDKAGHLARMQASGCFRYVREATLHHIDSGNAERLVGVLLSQGGVMGLLRKNFTEADLGIDALRTVAQRTLGHDPQPWHWSARVRLGVV